MKITREQLKKHCDLNDTAIDWNAVVVNMPEAIGKKVLTHAAEYLEGLQEHLSGLSDATIHALGAETLNSRLEELNRLSIRILRARDSEHPSDLRNTANVVSIAG